MRTQQMTQTLIDPVNLSLQSSRAVQVPPRRFAGMYKKENPHSQNINYQQQAQNLHKTASKRAAMVGRLR